MKLVLLNMLIVCLLQISCTQMNNFDRPKSPIDKEGYFYKTLNGCELYIYNYIPTDKYKSTIFIISGITGINHLSEKDIIEQLSDNSNRVVVIHPRGTGYSEGVRGDITDFSVFINDYVEIIKNDKYCHSSNHKIILFGHSMSTAILLAVADKIVNVGGAILVNPPYLQKTAKGMSPSFFEYIKYAGYMLFAKHSPIVNMAGDPSIIENEEDKKEAEQRILDTLLVKYFSMNMMLESKKVMDSMIDYSKKANFPLLLIYGEKDNIVDRKGCDSIFNAWKNPNKIFLTVENGTHGKSTVLLSKDSINKWIYSLD